MYCCVKKNNATPCGAAHQAGASSLQSCSICKNRMRKLGARNRRIVMSGAPRRARAFSFVAMSPSTWRWFVFVLSRPNQSDHVEAQRSTEVGTPKDLAAETSPRGLLTEVRMAPASNRSLLYNPYLVEIYP
jgi:hypothetical protein